MKRTLSLLLCLLTILPILASCGSSLPEETGITAEETKETATEETKKPADTYKYPEIKDKLSWEKINAFSIAPGSGMSTDELRQLCADFFRFSKSALWTPDSSWNYIRNAHGSKDEIKKGQIYGGMPYIGLASCSVYRLMDWYDEETGVLNMKDDSGF